MEVDLEEALNIAGAGKYQLVHCALMLATLSSALLEIIGNAFILPAAACDLGLSESLKGILTSVPNIGIIVTAPFWGQAADTWGRKPMLLLSSTAAGLFGFLATFMPTLSSFALCKLAASLFLACPSSLGFVYAGEMLPQKRRDLGLLICNGFLTALSTLNPVLAWAILSTDWHYPLGSLDFRPWRLLTAVYAFPLLLVGLWMTKADESPKFLMAKGKEFEALEVLKNVYEKNNGVPGELYDVKSIVSSPKESAAASCPATALLRTSSNNSIVMLLKPPHFKWLALSGFLMFGLFSVLNGLFMFAPDTINKVISSDSVETGTICILMNQQNATTDVSCVDTISHDTFLIMVVTTIVYSIIVMGVSVYPTNKRNKLVGMYTTVAVACLCTGTLTNRKLAGVAMATLQLTSLGVGPLTAYAVHLFPTSLRGTAVGAVLMFGRLGSVVGATTAGVLLDVACNITFVAFTTLLALCAALSFLLPKDQTNVLQVPR